MPGIYYTDCKNNNFICFREAEEKARKTVTPKHVESSDNNIVQPSSTEASSPEPEDETPTTPPTANQYPRNLYPELTKPRQPQPDPGNSQPRHPDPRYNQPLYTGSKQSEPDPRYNQHVRPDPRHQQGNPDSRNNQPSNPDSRYQDPRYNPAGREDPRRIPIDHQPEERQPEHKKEEELPKPQVYYPNPSRPRRPSEPRMEVAAAPSQSVTMVGNPDDDGTIVVDTKDVKENTWTKLVPREKHCISGFVKDGRDECVGKEHSINTFFMFLVFTL